MLIRFAHILTLVLFAGLLPGCDSAEERADQHFQRALALLEEGDVDRALVELRNVFQLNGFHRDARLAYAEVAEDRGNIQEAFGQYLRLIEQYPDDLHGHKALARLSLAIGDWNRVEQHAHAANRLGPNDPEIQAILLALRYRDAIQNLDLPAAATAVADAEVLIAADPSLINARRVLIDDHVRGEEWDAALADVEAALEVAPKDLVMHRLKLAAMEKLGREDDVEAHLKSMVDLFPDEDGVHNALISWYVSRDRVDDAETFLRDRINRQVGGSEAYVQLVAFLSQYKGAAAARAEVERILAEADTDKTLFRAILAGLDFEAGDRQAAIAEMEDILEAAEPSDQTRRIEVTLARMLIQTRNPVAARARVEKVLEQDPSHVAALKLKAAWLIEDDMTGDAIVELRRALDQSPRDPEIMTLMADAYEREGNRDLMSEMLSLAVEASGAAPKESLRYAALLLSQNQLLPAEDVLLGALRVNADHPDLLSLLGNVYVRMEDWPRTDHVISTLERLGTDRTRALANELTARKLAGQNQDKELSAFLQRLAHEEGDLQSMAAFVRVRLAVGDVQGALDYLEQKRKEDPDNSALRFIKGVILVVDGNVEAAETIFRDLLDDHPKAENIWVALYNLHRAHGTAEAANAVLAEALEALPDSAHLLWIKAGKLELEGAFDEAIAIYEDLYERDSSSEVVANNLASLISTHRDDSADLERAYLIARRLQGTDFAPFQDTYGWIAHRLGNHDEALTYLEPAAAALPNDALIQYHLSQVYAALGRTADALATMNKAAELVEATGRRSEILEDVRATIARLEAKISTEN